MKRCNKCGEKKPLTDFYKNKSHADGLTKQCKPCCKANVRAYRKTEAGHANKIKSHARYKSQPHIKIREREQARERERTARLKSVREAWRKTESGKQSRRKTGEKMIALYPEKRKARTAVTNAIAAGKLPRAKSQRCAKCDEPATGYHHHLGYEREHWLDVIPVCTWCHAALDAKYPIAG
jgi:hypothetical protein